MEKIRKKIKNEEIRNLIIVILAVTLIFAYPNLKENLFLYLVIVSFSIFLRYIAQKLLGDRLGCMVTFKLWPIGAALGVMSLLLKTVYGFIFTALGYVEIIPYNFGRWGIKLIKMTPRDYAHIALAGIAVNMFFMLIFGVLYSINNSIEIFQIISLTNGLLALFNLLPIPQLEGGHIFTWSLWFWVILFCFNAGILFVVKGL